MTITLNTKNIITAAIIIGLIIAGYFFRGNIGGFFVNGPEKVVDKALTYLKHSTSDPEIDVTTLFTTDYRLQILGNYSYYKIEEWKLDSKPVGNDKYEIQVAGSATNAFGAKLQRAPIFIVEKRNEKWMIADSYDFAAINKVKDLYGKSDFEKHRLVEEMKSNIKIESWSFESTFGESVHGRGTIVNSSNLPVSFIKAKIEYKDNRGNVVNTDETYAVGGEELLPGKRRKFEWYTSSCYDCNRASIELVFD